MLGGAPDQSVDEGDGQPPHPPLHRMTPPVAVPDAVCAQVPVLGEAPALAALLVPAGLTARVLPEGSVAVLPKSIVS